MCWTLWNHCEHMRNSTTKKAQGRGYKGYINSLSSARYCYWEIWPACSSQMCCSAHALFNFLLQLRRWMDLVPWASLQCLRQNQSSGQSLDTAASAVPKRLKTRGTAWSQRHRSPQIHWSAAEHPWRLRSKLFDECDVERPGEAKTRPTRPGARHDGRLPIYLVGPKVVKGQATVQPGHCH